MMESCGDVDKWNPMLDDYNDESFNRYVIAARVEGVSSNAVVQLFVGGISPLLTEQGLINLMSPVAKILNVRLVTHKNIGFVTVYQKDAVKLMAFFNNYKLGDKYLTVKPSRPKKETAVEPTGAVGGSGSAVGTASASGGEEKQKQRTSNSSATKLVDELKIPALLCPTAAKHVRIGQLFLAKVLDVVSPSQFWICHYPCDAEGQLNELHTNMQKHYSSLSPKTGFRPNGSGLFAAPVRDSGNWCRVQALNFDTESVSVLLLDYGTREEVSITNLHSLEGQFCSLPFRAICCSLARIQGTPQWSQAAVDCMRQLLSNEQVHARVCDIDGYILSVEIVLSSGHTVNDELVKRGCASYVNGLERDSVQPNVASNSAGRSASSEESVTDYPTIKDMSRVLLTVGEQYDVVILSARDPNDVTVCREDSIADLTTLISELSNYQLSEPYVPHVGEIVAAQYAADNSCHRARVLSLDNSDNTAHVQFVDFGNIAAVDLKSVVQLQPRHLAFPVFGINIKFGSSGVDSESLEEYSNLKLKVVEQHGDRYVVSLIDDDTENHLAKSPSVQHTVCSVSDIRQFCLDSGKTYTAWVTDSTDVEKFYVQVQEFDYRAIDEQLQAIYFKKSGGYVPQQTGQLVVVYVAEEEAWYRAVVKEIENRNAIKCQLIDFGIHITKTNKDIGCFDRQLLKHPVVAFKCSFHNMVVSRVDSWKASYMKPMTDEYNMTVVDVKGDVHFVELVHVESSVNLKQKLIDGGWLVQVKSSNLPSVVSRSTVNNLPSNDTGEFPKSKLDGISFNNTSPSSKQTDVRSGCNIVKSESMLPALSDAEIRSICHNREKILVVHASSPSDFYIQSGSDSVRKKLGNLHESVNALCSHTSCMPDTVSIGQIVGAMHFDGIWYRAEVVDVESHGKLQVHFVDFGNTITANCAELRPLPDAVAVSLPRQAIHCAIDRAVGRQADGSWSVAVVEWFQNICNSSDFILKFIFKNDSGNVWMVDLIHAATGRTVKEMLSPQQLATQRVNSPPTKNTRNVSQHSPLRSDVGGKHVGGKTPHVTPERPAKDVSPAQQLATQKAYSPLKNTGAKNVSKHSPVLPDVAGKHVGGKTPTLLLSSVMKSASIQAGETVMVTCIHSPCNFFVQQQHEKNAEVLQELQSHCKTQDRAYRPKQVGELIAVMHNNHWYRAEILSLERADHADVFFVDCGYTVANVDVKNIRALPEHIATALPKLAVSCALGGISGTCTDGSYSEAAGKWFSDNYLQVPSNVTKVKPSGTPGPLLINLRNLTSATTARQSLLDYGMALASTGTAPDSAANSITHSSKAPDVGGKHVGGQTPHVTPARPAKDVSPAQQLATQKASSPSKSVGAKNVSKHSPVLPDVAGKQVSGKTPLLLSSILKSASIQAGETVMVTCIHSPCNFFVQQLHEKSAEVLQELQSHCKTQDRAYRPKQVGELIAVMHNNHWYRAEILSLERADHADVFFVDCGYTIANVDVKNIRALPEHIATALPKLAVSCALGGISGTCTDGSYSEAARTWFSDNYLQVHSNVTKVKPSGTPGPLLINLRNLKSTTTARQSLLGCGMALASTGTAPDSAANSITHPVPIQPQPCDIALPSVKPTTVTTSKQQRHFQDAPVLYEGATVSAIYAVFPVDFYVLHCNVAVLQETMSLAQKLEQYCSTSSSTSYCPQYVGEPVAAKFEGEWYRAEVVKLMSNDCIEVFFVDFGNTAVVSANDLRSLDKEFVKWPKQAVHCGIDGICGTDSGEGFSEAAVEWFNNSCCNSNATVTSVRFVDRKHLVNISVDGRDVKELLIAAGFARSSV